jgi:hypothetical protein
MREEGLLAGPRSSGVAASRNRPPYLGRGKIVGVEVDGLGE